MTVWWRLICTRCLPHSKAYIVLSFLTSLHSDVSVCSIIRSITPLCCHQVIGPLPTHPQKTFLGKMVGLLTSFTFTINRSLLFDLCTGTTCFKRKKSRFLDFLFTTYARSTSPHHQQVSIEAPKLLTFVVLFSLYKIGRHVQSVYTWYEIKVIFQSLLPDIYMPTLTLQYLSLLDTACTVARVTC